MNLVTYLSTGSFLPQKYAINTLQESIIIINESHTNHERLLSFLSKSRSIFSQFNIDRGHDGT